MPAFDDHETAANVSSAPRSADVPSPRLGETFCRRCGAEIPATDPGCLICGTDRDGNALAESTAREAVAKRIAQGEARDDSFRDRPGLVLATVFGATMFLGIPLIWSCRGFSTSAKICWTVATIVYSIVVFWAFGWAMLWCWRSIIGTT